MKTKFLSVVVLGIAVVAAAPMAVYGSKQAAPKGTYINDAAGNMRLSGLGQFSYKPPRNGSPGTVVGKAAAGGYILGIWKSQGLELRTREIDGVVVASGKTLLLDRANLTGSIQVEVTRSSENEQSSVPQTVLVTGSEATYTSSENKLVARGGVKLVRQDTGSGQSMTVNGSTATIHLSATKSKKNPVNSAVLDGPVTLAMKGQREEEDEKGKRMVPFTLDGQANRLDFDNAARTITLSGNVKISGDDPGLGGEMGGINRAVIHLLEAGGVDYVEMVGDPGRTEIKDKKGGGRKK